MLSPRPQTLEKGSWPRVAVVVLVGEVADSSAARHDVTIHHSRIIRRINRIQTQLDSKIHVLERNRDVGVVVDKVGAGEMSSRATPSTTGGRLCALQLDVEVFTYLAETLHFTAGGSRSRARTIRVILTKIKTILLVAIICAKVAAIIGRIGVQRANSSGDSCRREMDTRLANTDQIIKNTNKLLTKPGRNSINIVTQALEKMRHNINVRIHWWFVFENILARLNSLKVKTDGGLHEDHQQ